MDTTKSFSLNVSQFEFCILGYRYSTQRKSISDDNKNHVPSGNSNYTAEQTTATIKAYQWSFIYKRTYVDVYVTAYSETEVGVKMSYGAQH